MVTYQKVWASWQKHASWLLQWYMVKRRRTREEGGKDVVERGKWTEELEEPKLHSHWKHFSASSVRAPRVLRKAVWEFTDVALLHGAGQEGILVRDGAFGKGHVLKDEDSEMKVFGLWRQEWIEKLLLPSGRAIGWRGVSQRKESACSRACGRGLIESAEPANLVQLERKEKHSMWMTKGSNVTQRAWKW